MIFCGECVHFFVNPTTAENADGRCLAPAPAAIIKADRYTVAALTMLDCSVGKKKQKEGNQYGIKAAPDKSH
jgi:hypothetical protein